MIFCPQKWLEYEISQYDRFEDGKLSKNEFMAKYVADRQRSYSGGTESMIKVLFIIYFSAKFVSNHMPTSNTNALNFKLLFLLIFC